MSEPQILPAAFNDFGIRDLHLQRITSETELYASWPQGKMVADGERCHLFYNSGSEHSSSDLAIYERTSEDGGRTWSTPGTVLNERGWQKGVTAWAAGLGADQTTYVIARKRGGNFQLFHPSENPKGTRHVLLEKGRNETSWKETAIDWSWFGEVPVLYHSIRALSHGGFETFWHLDDLTNGIMRFENGLMLHIPFPLENDQREPCEGTALSLREDPTELIGFFRSQKGSPIFWRADGEYRNFSMAVIEGISALKSPVGLAACGDRILGVSCDRWGTAGVYLHVADRNRLLEGSNEWATMRIAQMQTNPSGTSGTGVPSIAVLPSGRFVLAFGYDPVISPGQLNRASIWALSGELKS